MSYYKGNFHPNCGTNIQLSNKRKTATCTSTDYDQRFIMSVKAIKPNQEICLKFIRAYRAEPFTFGFTTAHPDQMGGWLNFHNFRENSVTWTYEVKSLARDSHLSFSYNEEGDISYTLNGQTKTFPRRKIAGEPHLWALMYLRGNDACVTLATPQQLSQNARAERVQPQIEALRFQSHNFQYKPLKVMVRRRNPDNGAKQMWLFGEVPIEFHHRIVIAIKRAPSEYQNNLLMGVTSYDPIDIDWELDIPTHSQLRNNDDVGWFKITSIPVTAQNTGDELSYSITPDLSLQFRKNNEEPEEIMVLDPELIGHGRFDLWPFVKITGEEAMFITMFSGQRLPSNRSNNTPLKTSNEYKKNVSKNTVEETTKNVNLPGPSTSSTDMAGAAPLEFHTRAHTPKVSLADNDTVAMFCGVDNTFLYTNRPINAGEKLQLRISYLCEMQVVIGFAFTHFSPEKTAQKPNVEALEHVEYMLHGAGNPSYNTVFIINGPAQHDVGFSFDQSGKLTRFEHGSTEISGRVDVAKPVWGLIQIEGQLRRRMKAELATVIVEISQPEPVLSRPMAVSASIAQGAARNEVNSNHTQPPSDPQVPEFRYQPRTYQFQSLKYSILMRTPQDKAPQVWIFGKSPIEFNQPIVTFVAEPPNYTQSNIVLGITSHNPKRIHSDELLPTHYQLKNGQIKEWIPVASGPIHPVTDKGTELAYVISTNHSLEYRTNDFPSKVVDVSSMAGGNMWHFVKLTGEEDMCVKLFKGRKITVKNAAETTGDSVEPLPGPSKSIAKKAECAICYGTKVDAVLYRCGHNCMCMECAQKQWKGRGSSGQCPLCREPILDVIRLFQ